MKEEMKKILRMVEQNKITIEEAESLMDAISSDRDETYEDTDAQITKKAQSQEGKFLRVRVAEDGVEKVQVNVPLALVEVGLKMGMKIGPQFSPEMEKIKDIDFNELLDAIRQGASGKLVEVRDGSDLVEVYVD